MEAHQAETPYYRTVDNTRPAQTEQPLARSYQPLDLSKVERKKQEQELSFFSHIAAYSLLTMLILSVFLAILPGIIALPIGLLLPIGVILGAKRLWKMINEKRR